LNQAAVPYERRRKRGMRRRRRRRRELIGYGGLVKKITVTPMNQEEAQFLGSLPRLPLLCGSQTWKRSIT
jgi:hypothetical protein